MKTCVNYVCDSACTYTTILIRQQWGSLSRRKYGLKIIGSSPHPFTNLSLYQHRRDVFSPQVKVFLLSSFLWLLTQSPAHILSEDLFSPHDLPGEACLTVARVLAVFMEMWALCTIPCLTIWAMLCSLIHLDGAHPVDLAQDSVSLLLKTLSFAASICFTSIYFKAPYC